MNKNLLTDQKVFFLIFLFSPLFLFSLTAQSLTNSNDVDFNSQWSSYWEFEARKIPSSRINPYNQVFKTPSEEFAIHVRPEFKISQPENKWVLRPGWSFTSERVVSSQNQIISDSLIPPSVMAKWTNADPQQKIKSNGKLDIYDAFWESAVNDQWTITSGLQVFQWGPSEAINVSNPFFQFSKNQQTFSYKEKGHFLIRANYSPTQENSWIMILEPTSNREKYNLAEREFKPQWSIKFEYSPQNSRNYGGALFGQEQQGSPFLGEYGQWEISEGHSFIFDLKQSYQLEHYKLKYNEDEKASAQLSQLYPDSGWNLKVDDSKIISHLATFGYRFEGLWDFRIEWIYNQLGLNREDRQKLTHRLQTIYDPHYTNNLERYSNLGLPLTGQNYLYSSLRIRNPFSREDLNVYLRGLYSLESDSGFTQIESDWGIGDRWTVYGSISQSLGDEDSEFLFSERFRASVGLKILH